MASKQELEYQFEKLLARHAQASALLGVRTKHWKGRCTKEELEDAAATAAVNPLVLGKRAKERTGAGDSGVNRAGE